MACACRVCYGTLLRVCHDCPASCGFLPAASCTGGGSGCTRTEGCCIGCLQRGETSRLHSWGGLCGLSPDRGVLYRFGHTKNRAFTPIGGFCQKKPACLPRGHKLSLVFCVYSRVGASCVARPTCVCAVWAPIRRINTPFSHFRQNIRSRA